MSQFKTDYLVIGSGLAGLSSALYASKYGNVTLLTKSSLDVSNTYWAQGGIAAAIDKEDSPENHFNDTMKTGAGLCREDAVRILVNEGVDRINELIEAGMPFDKENGEIALGLEGNHSKRRVLHAGGDATGKELFKFYLNLVKQSDKINIKEHTQVFELVIKDNVFYGLHAYDLANGENYTFISRVVIIATGGTSGIYHRTTNPHSTTGDGVVLAYNAGAEIANMELIQFHPTSLVTGSGETFLISEAVRGEGAYLVNSSGERFMKTAHELGELAPRDVVAYEMHKQLKQEGNKVFLKLDHLDRDKIKSRFKNIFDEVKKHGIEITRDPIPVAPAAHYMIGGIKTGLSGETNIRGVYACGEVTCSGVHGANRLASNSLLECLVFSKRAVEHAVDSAKRIEARSIDVKTYTREIAKQQNYLKQRNKVAGLLSNCAGVVRNHDGLNKLLSGLRDIENEYSFEENEYHSIRLKTLLSVSKLIALGAVERKESRGCHIREDFPETREEFNIDIVHKRNSKIKPEPVQ